MCSQKGPKPVSSVAYISRVTQTICPCRMKRVPSHLIRARPRHPSHFSLIPTGHPVLSATFGFKPVAVLFKECIFPCKIHKGRQRSYKTCLTVCRPPLWSDFLATDQEARVRFLTLPKEKIVGLERGHSAS
jgi:hypothetical protein